MSHLVKVLMIAAALTSTTCAHAVRVADTADSAADALQHASGVGHYTKVFYADGAAEGRVVSLGQQQFRVGDVRLQAAQVDSLLIRRQRGPSWGAVAAGVGVGGVVALFVGDLASDGAPYSRTSWGVGGALIGGLLGFVLYASDANVAWERRWPADRS